MRAPARPRSARSRSGKSASGSAPSRTSVSILPSAAARRMPAVSRPLPVGNVGQRSANQLAARFERHPTGQQAGRQAQLEGAVHVGPAQGAEEADVGQRVVDRRRGGGDRPTRLGQVGATDDDRDRAVGHELGGGPQRLGRDPADLVVDVAARDQRPHHGQGVPGAVAQRGGGELVGETGRGGGQLDHLDPVVEHGVAQPQEEDRQLFLHVGAEDEHGAAGAAGVVDGGPGQAQHGLGRQAVAHLGVHVVGPDQALGQLDPGVLVLVGEPGAADDGEAVGPAAVEALAHRGGHRGGAPRSRWRASATAPHRARAGCRGGPRCSRPRSRSGPCRTASPS